MISQIFDAGSFKVLTLFALSPGSRFRRKEIKEKTRIHNVPLDSTLLKLISSGILKKERNLYCLNLESDDTEQIITILSSQYKQLKNLPLDVYFLLADMAGDLSIIKEAEAWLFGSYSKMVYSEKSDVDIALLMPEQFDKKKREMIVKLFRKLEKHYNKEVEEHFFEKNNFYKNKKDPLVRDIIQNGTRLL